MEKEISSKELIRFIEKITKLEPIYFIGVARIMNITIAETNGEVRALEEIMSDVIDKFISYNRIQRKNLYKIIKQVK